VADYRIICLDASNMTLEQAVALERLWRSIWPPEDEPLSERLIEQYAREKLRLTRVQNTPLAQRRRVFAVHEGGQLVAASLVYPRHVFSRERGILVAGLAGVVTRPDHRGQGLGRAVVDAVFELVNRGEFECSLFQTTEPVQAFYEKLGARRVYNEFYNSQDDDASCQPFWDPVRMIYPATYDWPSGPIDTQGRFGLDL
jgi:GNAT superfamily N-acetyltransferase